MYRQSEKNLLSSNTSSRYRHNMVNFGLLAAEIVSLVWGTPANFNGFRVLAALLHGTLVVGVSQTLRCGTRNGITELLQRAPPIFGRAAITLGIGPNSSYLCVDLWQKTSIRPCLVLLYPVYTIQPVVNRLLNRFDNRFDNRVERTATVRSTGCQTGLYNRIDNRLYTRYSRLLNRFDNWFDNLLYHVNGA